MTWCWAAWSVVLAAAVEQRQWLPGDGTCHSDLGYMTVYEEVLGVNDYAGEPGKFVEAVLRKLHVEHHHTASLLEVGPGPGHIARAFGKVFTDISLVEPNPHFRKALGRRFAMGGLPYEMFPGKFEDFSCRIAGYDLVVLSHMLYHVDKEKRAQYLDQAYGCLAVGGLLAVAMVHDGGDQFDFVQQFDQKNSSAGEVRRHFQSKGLAWESMVDPSTIVFNGTSVADNFETAYRFVYFLVVEDAMNRAAYASMRAEEAKAFEKQLRDYTWSLMEPSTGTFSLTVIDEYVFVKKGDGSREL